MPDSKITDYAALTGAGAADTDLIEVVDVSDTSMAATGTNKKMALSELGTKLGGGGGGGRVIPRVLYSPTGATYRVGALKGLDSYRVDAYDNAADRAWFVWMPSLPGVKLDRVYLYVLAGGDATAKIRLGVYAAQNTNPTSLDGLVGTLLADSGQLDGANAGQRSMTGLALTFPAAGVWLAFKVENSTTAWPHIHALDVNFGGGDTAQPSYDPSDVRGGVMAVHNLTGAYPSTVTGFVNIVGGVGWLMPDFGVGLST